MNQHRITSNYLSCIFYWYGVNIWTYKHPTIFYMPNNRINTVRTYSNIQTSVCRFPYLSIFHFHIFAYSFRTNQICDIMNIIRPPGNRRTQIVLRNIPISNAVVAYQQRFIQRLHRLRIEEINCLRTIGIELYKLL